MNIYWKKERKGKGKEYRFDESLLFEGEYLNGERNGKGKEYDKESNLRFEGEYLYSYKRRGKNITKVDKNLNEIIYSIKNSIERIIMKMVM